MAHRHKNKAPKRNRTHAIKPANLRPAGMPPKVVPTPTVPPAPAVDPKVAE